MLNITYNKVEKYGKKYIKKSRKKKKTFPTLFIYHCIFSIKSYRKVTAAFFKKLGEKLRNYQRYQKPVQLSGSSSVHSSPLDLVISLFSIENKTEYQIEFINRCDLL